MTIVKNINGLPHIEGLLCTYDTKEIRSELELLMSTSDEIELPIKYSYEVIYVNNLPYVRRAKIIASRHREEKLDKLISN